ncbi:DUF2513 domain-containing protein [Lacipirellula parvula]|uniref:DUF2513 domain-containing protein n=1 Tax=Lacipirellula parvula TaxID=2650471 RepID=A0A5K7X8J8_9BACT|nr:DUF2513 domain-containing protein [Lacipirellula parvula]BBO32177.1 hypothetical protein PLANPX_1789 [Lacipirellula parvula]
MKRDLDLARQLLLEIENRGADCSVSVLRSGPNHEAEERIRYHLRLLIDAGLLKEVDRTAGGVPCVRLTDAGHETIELTRSESRWRDAKFACQERTGGLSMGVIRDILAHWSLDAPRYRSRRRYAVEGPALVEGRYRGRRSPYRFEPFIENEVSAILDDDVRYVRVRPSRANGWRYEPLESDSVRSAEFGVDATLPDYLL